MPPEKQTTSADIGAARQPAPQPAAHGTDAAEQPAPEPALIQRARRAPRAVTPQQVLQLQRLIGNQRVGQLLPGVARPRQTTPGPLVQRLTDEQQEVLDSLPALISGNPRAAVELLDELDQDDRPAIVAALGKDDIDQVMPTAIANSPRTALELLNQLAEADLRAVVGGLAKADIERLMTSVRGASAGLVDFAQPYAELIGTIRNESIAASAEALEDQLDWIASGLSENLNPATMGRNVRGVNTDLRTNHFTTWILGGQEPSDASSMNCWEACLYAGFKAGIFPFAMLRTIYVEAAKHTKQTAQKEMQKIHKTGVQPTIEMVRQPVQEAYREALGAFLGAQEGERWQADDDAPPRGYLLFFNGVNHVALSLGRMVNDSPEVMSLWCMPGPQPVFQRTTLREILENASDEYTITMAPPPW